MPPAKARVYSPHARARAGHEALQAPARPDAVPRPGLIARREEARERPLVLVSAPAGFGKSTLLSTWVDTRSRREPKLRAGWLSLDEADSDPSRFLLYMAAALHAAEASCGADAMSALQSPQPVSAEAILTDLVNEIDGADVQILLVLDDYHAVRSTDVDQQLAFLLEHRPAHWTYPEFVDTGLSSILEVQEGNGRYEKEVHQGVQARCRAAPGVRDEAGTSD